MPKRRFRSNRESDIRRSLAIMPTALIGEPLGHMPSLGLASSTHFQGIAAHESTQKDLLTGNLRFELIEPSRCAEIRSNSAVRRRAYLARLPATGSIPPKGRGNRHAESGAENTCELPVPRGWRHLSVRQPPSRGLTIAVDFKSPARRSTRSDGPLNFPLSRKLRKHFQSIVHRQNKLWNNRVLPFLPFFAVGDFPG